MYTYTKTQTSRFRAKIECARVREGNRELCVWVCSLYWIGTVQREHTHTHTYTQPCERAQSMIFSLSFSFYLSFFLGSTLLHRANYEAKREQVFHKNLRKSQWTTVRASGESTVCAKIQPDNVYAWFRTLNLRGCLKPIDVHQQISLLLKRPLGLLSRYISSVPGSAFIQTLESVDSNRNKLDWPFEPIIQKVVIWPTAFRQFSQKSLPTIVFKLLDITVIFFFGLKDAKHRISGKNRFKRLMKNQIEMAYSKRPFFATIFNFCFIQYQGRWYQIKKTLAGWIKSDESGIQYTKYLIRICATNIFLVGSFEMCAYYASHRECVQNVAEWNKAIFCNGIVVQCIPLPSLKMYLVRRLFNLIHTHVCVCTQYALYRFLQFFMCSFFSFLWVTSFSVLFFTLLLRYGLFFRYFIHIYSLCTVYIVCHKFSVFRLVCQFFSALRHSTYTILLFFF